MPAVPVKAIYRSELPELRVNVTWLAAAVKVSVSAEVVIAELNDVMLAAVLPVAALPVGRGLVLDTGTPF